MSARIVIDAQLSPGGESGGVEQFVTGLLRALGKLYDGSEEYLIVVREGQTDWLNPHLGRNQRLVVRHSSPWDSAKQWLGPLRNPVRKIRRIARRALSVDVPQSNGFYEKLGADVLHLPHQRFVRSQIPTVYNPHDLQHLHYPQFFSSEELAERQVVYSTGCTSAQAVATDSEWGKVDLVDQLSIDPSKVYAIPMAPPRRCTKN